MAPRLSGQPPTQAPRDDDIRGDSMNPRIRAVDEHGAVHDLGDLADVGVRPTA